MYDIGGRIRMGVFAEIQFFNSRNKIDDQLSGDIVCRTVIPAAGLPRGNGNYSIAVDHSMLTFDRNDCFIGRFERYIQA